MKSYSLADVARHARKDDLYMIYQNQVYDVTPFVSEHPGGEEIVLDQAGKDGTVAFDEVGHSKDAHDQLRELLVGRLDQASADAVAKARVGSKQVKKAPSSTVTLYSVITAIIAATLAAYLYSLQNEHALRDLGQRISSSLH